MSMKTYWFDDGAILLVLHLTFDGNMVMYNVLC